MDGTQYPNLPPSDGVDLSKYAEHIAHLDLSEEQQTELLRAVWAIMTAFADYGFGIEPTQLICGWIEENRRKSALTAPDAVESENRSTIQSFESAATDAAGKRDS